MDVRPGPEVAGAHPGPAAVGTPGRSCAEGSGDSTAHSGGTGSVGAATASNPNGPGGHPPQWNAVRPPLRGRSLCVGRDQTPPMPTYLYSRNSSMPTSPPSRPRPDCLMPPNGAAGLETTPWLRPTIPASNASLTRKARLRSVV